MAQENINAGESGLAVRTKLNNMFAELYSKTNILISDLAGYVPEITELNDGQVMINTHDLKKYTRLGEVLIVEDVIIHPNFTIDSFTPDFVDEQTTGNVITVTGTGFIEGMEVLIFYDPAFTIENVSLNFISETEIQIIFDAPDDIIYDDSDVVIFALKKGIYTNEDILIDILIEPEDLRAEITGQNPDPILEGSGTTFSLTGERFTGATNVRMAMGGPGDNWTLNSMTVVSDTQIDVDADISIGIGGTGTVTRRFYVTNPEGESNYTLLNIS